MSDIEIIKKYGSIENYIYELKQENKRLKEVIEEVREYIKAETKREAFHHYLSDEDLDKLLQILDKVKEN